jgi:hypothetical protein
MLPDHGDASHEYPTRTMLVIARSCMIAGARMQVDELKAKTKAA